MDNNTCECCCQGYKSMTVVVSGISDEFGEPATFVGELSNGVIVWDGQASQRMWEERARAESSRRRN